MRRSIVALVAVLVVRLCACSSGDTAASSDGDAGADARGDSGFDSGGQDAEADVTSVDASDVGSDACSVFGAPGECITVSECAALGDHTSYAGHCPGPTSIECCIKTPNVADDPPIPAGYKLMLQSEVTPDMTAWAVAILNDPVTYPMFSTTTKTFGTLTVLARVEWHPPDFLNSAVHRGVTLYEPV